MKFRITRSGLAEVGEIFNVYFLKDGEWYLWTYRYSENTARDVVRDAIMDDPLPLVEEVVGEFDSENMP